MARDFRNGLSVNGTDVSLEGHDHDHIINLATDSRLLADDPTEYPTGLSEMYSEDDATAGTFAFMNGGKCMLRTRRYHDVGLGADGAIQDVMDTPSGTSFPWYRQWTPGDTSWGAWVGTNHWDFITSKPATFPPSAHEHDHIVNLATDSRLHDDPLTDYPTGYSSMPSADYETAGTFASEWNPGVVETTRYSDEVDELEKGFQVHKSPPGNIGTMIAYRSWNGTGGVWGAWETVNKWDDLTNKPSTFPPSTHATTHKGDGSDAIANATTSVAGLESAADKTKLDGIESGATADQTAAEILTAIKTVDGSGSGLDADLLDGSNSSAFAAATHATTHVTGGSDVIANAVAGGNAGLLSGTDKTKLDGVESGATADQTPAEIRAAIKLAEDAFDGSAGISSFDVGVTYLPISTSSTGWPIAATTFHVIILKQDGSSAKQVAIQRTAARHWERHWTGAAWSSWVETTDVANLTGYSSLVLATDYEDADVLAKVKNVDGAGSGLDADLLDGHDTGYFATASHAAQHKGDGSDPIANATQTVAGLESAADKTKLDGIETGATQDQTPAEIRAALKYATDALAESAAITSFDEGVSLMLTTAGANWGPNTGEAGRVLTERSGSVGTQQFLTDNGKVFYRAYSGSWGSWIETNAWNDLTGKPSTFSPSTHATSHVTGGSDVIANAVASGNAGLLSGSDKSKLDGIESGATQDQTAAEILTAIKTVDGSTSGLDADLLDGHDTAYFATATGLSDHLADTSDAHDASAISVLDTGANFAGSDVETVLAEIADSATATGLLNTVEVNLGTVPRRGGHFDITTTGLTAGQNVIVEQINGPYTGKGTQADEAEMDQLTISGQAISNTVIRCYWNSTTHVRGNFKFGYTLVSTLNTVPEATTSTSGLLKSAFQQTHIEGLNLVWNTPGTNGTNLTVTSGSAWVPSASAVVDVPSTLTGPSMTFSASTWYYVYLTSSGTLEISTTAPASPYKGTARTKASDTSRRYLGQILSDTGNPPPMHSFRHLSDNSIYYDNADPSVTPFAVASNLSPGAESTLNLSGVVPPSVSELAHMGGAMTVSTTLGLVWVNFNLGAATKRIAEVGSTATVAGGYHIFTVDMPLNPATPSFLYTFTGPTGSLCSFRCYGYRFAR